MDFCSISGGAVPRLGRICAFGGQSRFEARRCRFRSSLVGTEAGNFGDAVAPMPARSSAYLGRTGAGA